MRRSPRFLIIDDNPGDLGLWRAAFEEAQWEVHIDDACTGAQAIDLLRRNAAITLHPDAILIDYRLLGVTSIATIRGIRRIPAHEEVPIVIVSGTPLPEANRQECLDLGVLRILTKAVTFSDFMTTIRIVKRILDGKGDMLQSGSWIEDGDVAELGGTH